MPNEVTKEELLLHSEGAVFRLSADGTESVHTMSFLTMGVKSLLKF